jgi:hypothetical protein
VQTQPLADATRSIGPVAECLVLDQHVDGSKCARRLGWQPAHGGFVDGVERYHSRVARITHRMSPSPRGLRADQSRIRRDPPATRDENTLEPDSVRRLRDVFSHLGVLAIRWRLDRVRRRACRSPRVST